MQATPVHFIMCHYCFLNIGYAYLKLWVAQFIFDLIFNYVLYNKQNYNISLTFLTFNRSVIKNVLLRYFTLFIKIMSI